MNNFTLPEILIILNCVFLFIIITLLILKHYADNFYHIGNLSKNRALKVINKISQAKLSLRSASDLANVICKKLTEDLNAKFAIALIESGKKISFYGDSKLAEEQHKKIMSQLSMMTPQTIYEKEKIIYFQPLIATDRNVGIIIAEDTLRNSETYSLEKIMPVICSQISIALYNTTIRKMLDEAKESEEREKLRSLILSSISHDLKTPLVTIIGSLSIFNKLSDQNSLTKKNQKTLILTALNETERLNEFISDILEMTKIESGAIKLHKHFLSPKLIVDKTLDRFERKVRHYKLEVNLDNKIQINFDPISLEQIMQNLIENSIKYSEKNTKIAIYDEIYDNCYKIFLKDDGIGINPEKLTQIFNKFERFSMEDKISGSGLGLSIVKALMDINNANICAQNAQAEKGTIFILTFNEFRKL